MPIALSPCLGLDGSPISSPPIPAPTRWRHGQRSRSYSGDQQRPIGNALFVFSRLEVDPTILRYFGMHHRIRLDSYLDPSLEFLRTPKHGGRSRMDGSMAGAFSLGTHYSLVTTRIHSFVGKRRSWFHPRPCTLPCTTHLDDSSSRFLPSFILGSRIHARRVGERAFAGRASGRR